MMLKPSERDLFKLSHRNLTLREHIERSIEIARSFLSFYGLSKYQDFVDNLCYYHDLGKLRPEWDVNNQRNPPHSPFSFDFALSDLTPEDHYLTAPFFILKHHGHLSISPHFIERNRSYFRRLIDYVENEKDEVKIDLCDCFGIFKLADVCSAHGIAIKPNIPRKKPEEIKEWLSERKGKKIDEKTLEIQMSLANIDEHVLLKAPTGWGKTLASLSYALGRGRKIIYVLPTITSIKILTRDLESLFGAENVGEIFYYVEAEALKEAGNLLESEVASLMLSKFFVKPVIITTLDQLLVTLLQVSKYFLKRPHLRRSTLILDEVHTFTSEMLTLLLFFLKRYIKLYDLRIFAMSATFPRSLRIFFEKMLGEKCRKILLDEEYMKRRRFMYHLKDQEVDSLIGEVATLAKEGRRIAVVCNSVEKSQKVYRLLKEEGIEDLGLLHARFTYMDRSEKEERLRSLKVLVATQVVEVSLDTSFDFMVTECAPIASIIQRLGRVNRYANRTDSVNVWITRSKMHPYSENEVEEAWNLLGEFEDANLLNEHSLISRYDESFCFSQDSQTWDWVKHVWDGQNGPRLFYSWRIDESDTHLQKLFGKDINILAIPATYRNKAIKLHKRLKEASSYAEKEAILGEIKGCTVPIPLTMAEKIERETDIEFPIVNIEYDNEYGIKKYPEKLP